MILAGITLLAWLGLGSLLLHPLRSSGDRLLDLLNRVGAGAVGFALLTMGLGWAGALHSTAFEILLALAAFGGIVRFATETRSLASPRLRKWRPWQMALAALLALYGLLAALATAAPVSSPDALLYHAADPRLFEDSLLIFEIPWNSSSYEPFAVEMLVLDGELVWDSVQGAFAPLLLTIVALAAVMGLAERIAGRSAALLAGTVFFAQPFMLWEASSVFVEPGLAAAVALASWNIAQFVRSPEGPSSTLILVGVFSGAAAGMKFLGLIAGAALATAFIVLAWSRLDARRLAAFAVPAIVVAAPWYVKNAILTGNPFFPHLLGGLNASAAAELERSMKSFGGGRDPLDFLLLPFRLLADGDLFDAGEWVSPLFLAFAPLALLVPQPRRIRLAVLMAILVFVIAWFLTSQQARFLVPLMPPAAVLAALGALAVAARGRLGRGVTITTFAVALASGLAASGVYAARLAPAAVGAESKEHFLQKNVSIYEGVDWLNHHLGPDHKVAVDFWSLLYLDVPYVTFGTMGELLPPEAGAAETRAFVEGNNVTHLAVLEGNVERRRQAEAIGARIVARVPVRSVRSRTRGELGPRQVMLVYAVPPAR